MIQQWEVYGLTAKLAALQKEIDELRETVNHNATVANAALGHFVDNPYPYKESTKPL